MFKWFIYNSLTLSCSSSMMRVLLLTALLMYHCPLTLASADNPQCNWEENKRVDIMWEKDLYVPHFYCGSLKMGWGEDRHATWWPAPFDVCARDNVGNACACTCRRQASTWETCASHWEPNQKNCYTERYWCEPANAAVAGKYRKGCGCTSAGDCSLGELVSCPAGTYGVEKTTAYDSVQFRRVNHEIIPTFHSATQGLKAWVCQNCSTGYYSNALGATVCTACPQGQRTNSEGATACSSCAAGQAFQKGILSAACTSCTCCDGKLDASVYDTTNCAKDCDGKYFKRIASVCTECKACPTNTYAKEDCVTDTTTQCLWAYLDKDGIQRTASNQVMGAPVKLPFEFGYQRKEGDAGSIAKRGFLPSYAPCPNNLDDELASLQMIRITDRQPPNAYEKDCDVRSMATCRPGYVAVRSPTTDRIQYCRPCPEHASLNSTGGSSCTCVDGYAKAASIQGVALSSGNSYSIPKYMLQADEEACYNCAYLSNNKISQPPLRCVQGKAPVRCGPGEYLSGATCQRCPMAGYKPSQDGLECEKCSLGEAGTNSTCSPCPEDTYADVTGLSRCKNASGYSCAVGYLYVSATATKDADCQRCTDCAGGGYKVVQSGKDANNTCTGTDKVQYYSCIDSWIATQVPVNKRLEYNLSTKTVTQTLCTTRPSHSEWVSVPKESKMGKQCYFSCLYGVDTTRLAAYKASIPKTYAPFLVENLQQPDYPQTTPNIYDERMYTTRDQCSPNCPSVDSSPKWGFTFSLNGLLNIKGPLPDTWQQNTFLSLDGANTTGLCHSPQQATSQESYPYLGYFYNNATSMPSCAWMALGGLYSSMTTTTKVKSYLVADPSTGKVVCRGSSPTGPWLHSYRNALDVLQEQAYANYLGAITDYQQRLALAVWNALRATSWPNGSPYTMQDKATQKCAQGYFLWVEKNACFSCSKANEICPLVNPLMYGQQQQCGETTTTVCTNCPSRPNAVLLLTSASPDYANWTNTRQGWGKLGQDITCRYTCNSGYTSSAKPLTYQDEPCVLCAANNDTCTTAASYVKATSICPSLELPTAAVCATCNSSGMPGVVFSNTQPKISSNSQCLATCNLSGFHAKVNGQYNDSWAPLSALTCQPCADNIERPCNRTSCPSGYFLSTWQNCSGCDCSNQLRSLPACQNASEQTACQQFYQNCTKSAACTQCPNVTTCVRCSTDSCPQGTTRTSCPAGSTQDSICSSCDRSLLQNPACKGSNDTLGELLCALRGVVTRRWRSQEGCQVACVNNFMWVDPSTGLWPQQPSALHHCIPCSSSYVQLSNPGSLYSLWNATNTTPLTQQRRTLPANVPGVCYPCPEGRGTSEVDVMCALLPGYSNISIGIPTASISIETLSVTTTITALRFPVVAADTTQYFACCKQMYGGSYNPEYTRCTQRAMPEYDAQIPLLGNNLGDGCLNSTTGRALLEAETDAFRCAAGTFKDVHGDGECEYCPTGSSTVFDATTSSFTCTCLPGYRRNGEACEACGAGRYRRQNDREDACTTCPAGKFASKTANAHCYCDPGTQEIANGTCKPCPSGFHCLVGQATPCPPNSFSLPNASSASDCVCNPGFYGALGAPNALCMTKPPTVQCTEKVQLEEQSCTCAAGWDQTLVYTPAGALQIHCTSSCPAGHWSNVSEARGYSITNTLQQCVPCPQDTFSSSRQAMSAEQCTPCPAGFNTGGATGRASPDDCYCQKAVVEGRCTSCAPNHYIDEQTQECTPCPEGMTAPLESRGLASCACKAGTQFAFGNLGLGICVQCPLGTFKVGVGSTCTQCPEGTTTAQVGATSMVQCVCADGSPMFAGRCL